MEEIQGVDKWHHKSAHDKCIMFGVFFRNSCGEKSRSAMPEILSDIQLRETTTTARCKKWKSTKRNFLVPRPYKQHQNRSCL